MENLKVRTIRRHSYGGKVYMQGAEYFVDNPKHLAFLVAIKKVKPIPAVEPAPAPVKKQVTPQKRSNKPGGRYERKDVSRTPANKKANPVKNANTSKRR